MKRIVTSQFNTQRDDVHNSLERVCRIYGNVPGSLIIYAVIIADDNRFEGL